ncbi:11298_t:CDS:2, partial [Dentiscutata erythropus]
IKHYNDGSGTILVQIVRKNSSATPSAALKIDVGLGIPYPNYCFGSDVFLRPIRVYPLYNDLMLVVTYTNAADESDYSTFQYSSGNHAWTPNNAVIRINIDPSDVNVKISLLAGDIFMVPIEISTTISTIDGGYAIVFANVTPDSSISINNPFMTHPGL